MVYDLESLPNIFTAMFSDDSIFEISWRKNEIKELISFLSNISELVGFNNLEYDYPLLHFVIENQHRITVEAIYQKSIQLLQTPFGQGWRNRIPEYRQHIKQIDLRLIHHFNNSAKMTSLKALQFAMRVSNIKEFSVGFDQSLTNMEINELISYNHNDVESTVVFLERSKEQINLRKEFESVLGTNCLNFNDSKLGGKYFEKELERLNPGCLYDISTGDKNQTLRKPPFTIPFFTLDGSYNDDLPIEFHLPPKPIPDASCQPCKNDFESKALRKTAVKKQERSINKFQKSLKKWPKTCEKKHERNLKAVWIPVKDILLDFLEFERPEFQKVLESYRNYNITQTKGGFSEVCSINNFDFHFGQGGIHGSIKNSTIRSDNKHVIRDIDIKSAYPKIAIINKLFPKHLGAKFCEIYEDVYQQRKQYEKGTSLNLAFKLALNSVFGNSINEYSVFYDPSFGMQITINGQLLVCMLAEQLMKLDGLQLIQINTDGLTIRYLREFTPWVESVEQWWMNFTKLELENVNYQAMFIRDVNNYLGWFENGEKKRKGIFAYEVKPSELEWHKNHSGLIIPKAVEAFLTQGTDVKEFIHNHRDPFDFMMRGKVDRKTKLVLAKELEFSETPGMFPLVETEQQRIVRFYFSKEGGELFKYMPPLAKETELANKENRKPKNRRSAYQGSKGRKVKICNELTEHDRLDVDFDYYVDRVTEIIADLTKTV